MAKSEKKGLLITFEGPDGSGKSTQIRLLQTFLEKQQRPFILTREPGGTPIGERIREVILDVACREMDPRTEALLYAAARAQHVAEVILPALKRGEIVICDRFMDSSMVYQAEARQLGEPVRAMNEFAVRGLSPDVTFLLLIDPEKGKERIKRAHDRLEQEASDFHRKVYEGYRRLAASFPERIVELDGSAAPETLAEAVRERLSACLGPAEAERCGGGR